MSFEMPQFAMAAPEIWVAIMLCVVLVVDLFASGRESAPAFYLTQFTLVVAAWLALETHWGEAATTFNGMYVSDSLAAVLKVAICVISLLALAYSRDYLRQRDLLRGEYYLLGLFAVLGMLVMASAASLLVLYIGLEMLSLSLYAMVAFDRESRIGAEAAMKYFVLGALSSGMLLYGMSMIYGATGSLLLADVAAASSGEANLLLAFGMTFALVGVAFKFGAVPFHMWIPDVYQGAPTASTLFIGSAPKVAALALFVRLLGEGLGGLHDQWQVMAVILAVGSLVVGNLVALVQTNLKRMLAYSTISHIGFLFLGLIAGSDDGYAAALFYAISYGLMAAGAFGMIILLSRRGFEAEMIDDMKGLNERHSGFAFVMLLLMFSMTGIPGTVGFYAKWLVLQALIDAGLIWLAVLAVVFAVIGAFYYLRVLKAVYFDRLESDGPPLEAPLGQRVMLAANGGAVLLLGLFPDALISACRAAFGL
ncbi:NADH-quinone oxidoreductase subunit NuoN [Sediminicurvatus halobius]|uniref:NADH-quinone oxidoreductase subunit N n=1 Tax=Sediminicurvatus halobius TaxID=2182432 RepID=A0A2U2MY51_9GAMM|nr:NADH-quinone oxidoreductase subunit NuoN [Spiribacter halobius]PWG61723.1 NADH-quinone oxidoreductase subunit NuoN [Spiribacter halobius]UEX76851.1 NADH-quinone oxidoreductase subunit NuoN [Spiribacter halobius]